MSAACPSAAAAAQSHAPHLCMHSICKHAGTLHSYIRCVGTDLQAQICRIADASHGQRVSWRDPIRIIANAVVHAADNKILERAAAHLPSVHMPQPDVNLTGCCLQYLAKMDLDELVELVRDAVVSHAASLLRDQPDADIPVIVVDFPVPLFMLRSLRWGLTDSTSFLSHASTVPSWRLQHHAARPAPVGDHGRRVPMLVFKQRTLKQSIAQYYCAIAVTSLCKRSWT